ncbi:hypothetical protein KIL84_004529 [Mauremys mutica]|uniref:Uncharacterized protein n=1 Tax=Mauremys mutica TaxID=74926 RepID=A0A9D3XN52_9SAUR|nr:hypothetical protein KIL84_004529 [Mauremys mutica]
MNSSSTIALGCSLSRGQGLTGPWSLNLLLVPRGGGRLRFTGALGTKNIWASIPGGPQIGQGPRGPCLEAMPLNQERDTRGDGTWGDLLVAMLLPFCGQSGQPSPSPVNGNQAEPSSPAIGSPVPY